MTQTLDATDTLDTTDDSPAGRVGTWLAAFQQALTARDVDRAVERSRPPASGGTWSASPGTSPPLKGTTASGAC